MAVNHKQIQGFWLRRIPGAPLVILAHGYAQNESFFTHFAQRLEGFSAVALRAPIELDEHDLLLSPEPLPGGDFAWYEVFSLDAIIDTPSAGLEDSSALVKQWIETNAGEYRTIHLAGFSQGGTIMGHLLRTWPERFASLALLSSLLSSHPMPGDSDIAKRKVPVFYSHGGTDPVISSIAIKRTSNWITQHGSENERYYACMGHAFQEAPQLDYLEFLRKQTNLAAQH